MVFCTVPICKFCEQKTRFGAGLFYFVELKMPILLFLPHLSDVIGRISGFTLCDVDFGLSPLSLASKHRT